ncbi:symmetrical bis(5'-nucleosyl)-tetraphosphatase [Agaribacter flavus]|uniref:bis(5'-nucleosyl)-tetraphosphatase (symmetrical) n=1 Tax=Agaribacter flavus TaxID=1902781 RepID=A0ABV7FUP7_9ALTE
MMRNFVVGDIQGCYKGLKGLLKKANFNPSTDKLWAVGDLVARGPDSLSTLEYCRDLGDAFDSVLGNHDLHLIAVAHGIREAKPQDKLQSLLQSKHFDSLIDWLKCRPLALKPAKKTLITHAGLYPSWSIKEALKHSENVCSHLNSDDAPNFLKNMYGNKPDLWCKENTDADRKRFIVNAMTRMRYLRRDLSLEFDHKCHPRYSSKDLLPWFYFTNPKLTNKHRIIFGHWASLNGDVKLSKDHKHQLFALDTGYVWGNTLTLLCLENNQLIQYPA